MASQPQLGGNWRPQPMSNHGRRLASNRVAYSLAVLLFHVLTDHVRPFAPPPPMSYRRPPLHRHVSSVLPPPRSPPLPLCAAPVQAASSMPKIAWWYLSLLALQFGCQPILTKRYTPKTVNRKVVVLCQDCVRFLTCMLCLLLSGSWGSSTVNWTINGAILGAGVPSVLYLLQNYCTIVAYQNLAPITFNVLNQTKTLSAALCCFLVMGKAQSKMQIVSLFVLLSSALVIEKVIPLGYFTRREVNGAETSEEKVSNQHFSTGVIPVLLASFISGLAGAMSQKTLQKAGGRNSYLFSMELSFFSIVILIANLVPEFVRNRVKTSDENKVDAKQTNMLEGWSWATWIPILTNAGGGVVVGLVTKHAGSVKKGFALIFGMLLSGLLQSVLNENEGQGSGRVTREQVVGGCLAALSLWMHSKYPPLAASSRR